MSNTKTLQEVLASTDEELTANWSKLGALITRYEKKDWKYSRALAIELLHDDRAMDYIQAVRDEIANDRKKSIPSSKTSKPISKKKKSKVKTKAKVVPINTKRDRYSMNYKRLLELIPDIIERLENGEEIYGKSTNTGYMDFNIELIHRDKKGFYLALSHHYKQNGDLIPDPDMQVFVDVKNQLILALAFQNSIYFREVYDDIYSRKLVNTREQKAQNSFLETWLKNLINQGHEIEWRHDEEEEEKAESDDSSKPDISFIPKELRDSLQSVVLETAIDKVTQAYSDHKEGEITLNPLSLFFVVERLNDTAENEKLPYPSAQTLDEYFQSLRPKNYDEVMTALDEEVKKTEEFLSEFDSAIFSENFELLLKLAPNLTERLNKYGRYIHGRSIKEGLLYDVVLNVPEKNDENYTIMLTEANESGKNKIIDEHFAMEMLIDPKKKEVKALLTYLANGEVEEVYSEYGEDIVTEAEKERLIGQNNALKSWLTELVQSGHLIEWDDSKFNIVEKKNEEKQIDPEAEATVKQLKKLTEFIQSTENVGAEKAKEKALRLKKDGNAEQYILQRINRYQQVSKNQILKTNYQKLIRLVPSLFTLLKKDASPIILDSEKNASLIYVTSLGKEGKFTTRFELRESNYASKSWVILVQKTGKKVSVDFEIEKEKEIRTTSQNEKFGNWIDEQLKDKYKNATELISAREKYPIVIGLSEAGDENLGFNSLEELHDRLKTYPILAKDAGYYKTYVLFRGYQNRVLIDVSASKSSFNPNQSNYSLEDWLKKYDADFDWSQFRDKTPRNEESPEDKREVRKKLQKDVEQIPDFEVGKVKWTKLHKRHGITKRQIAWINKNKQGLTITPLAKSKTKILGNTEDIISDFNKQAMPFGKRISRTGKIYYETRSNRADVTNRGL